MTASSWLSTTNTHINPLTPSGATWVQL